MPKPIKGKVLWFDNIVGEGIIKNENGERFYVHYSAIQPCQTLAKTPRPKKNVETLELNKVLKANQDVEFTLYENAYLKQVKTVRGIA